MKRKLYLSTSLLLLVVTLGVAYYYFNKPHKSIDHIDTEWISAHSLLQQFETDETIANARFLNKGLTVGGIIGEISENNEGQQVILLRGPNESIAVQCTLKDRTTRSIGDSVQISGFCSGYTLAVILDDSKILK